MYIRQTDLFWGLNQNVVNRIMSLARREVVAQGETLFRSADAARHVFILAQGEVEITMGESQKQVYTGNQVGEVFGLGSLVDRKIYGGDATCNTQVVVLKLERDKLLKIFESDTGSGYLFFKQLSKALGGRLIHAYRQMTVT